MGLATMWVGLAFHGVAVALNIIGVATNHWLEFQVTRRKEYYDDDYDYDEYSETTIDHWIGLFESCSSDRGGCFVIMEVAPSSLVKEIFMAAQATMIIGMLLGILSLFFSATNVVMALLSKYKRRKAIMAFAVITFIFAPLSSFPAIIAFFWETEITNNHWSKGNFGYSFYICVFGILMIPLFGTLTIYGAPFPSAASPSTSTEASNDQLPSGSANTLNDEVNASSPTNSTSPDAQPSNGSMMHYGAFQGDRPTSPSQSMMNEPRPNASSSRPNGPPMQQTINEAKPTALAFDSEGRPVARTQSVYEGSSKMSSVNETRPLARTQSINTPENAIYHTMPTHYGAMPSGAYAENQYQQ